jgi:hypothetical protein
MSVVGNDVQSEGKKGVFFLYFKEEKEKKAFFRNNDTSKNANFLAVTILLLRIPCYLLL